MAKGGNKKANAAARAAANRLLADNRLARHQYEILDTLETGIELVGTEVKSIRAGQANLRDGFCLIRKGELQLHNVHISPHSHAGSYFNHDPLRTRKLLAHRREIDKLRGQLDRKGLTLIPLNLHLKGSWIKLTIGLGKGRKLHDKRQDEKRKQADREVKSALARY
ncbi:MAG: SsrA-binding protein SmpB [Cyanobacteriota bacterium]|nr:SsrA-binding protein SmpB [Cyanobacteriota bacterium]